MMSLRFVGGYFFVVISAMFWLTMAEYMLRRAKPIQGMSAFTLAMLTLFFAPTNYLGPFRYPAYVTTIGGVLLILNFEQLWRSIRASRWKEVVGRVIKSEIIPAPSVSPNIGTVFQVHIEYEYSVEGRQLRSRRISPYLRPQAEYRFYDEAKNVIRSYPAGATIKAIYNPNRPSEAYLSHRISQTALLLWVASIVLTGGGIAWAINGLQR